MSLASGYIGRLIPYFLSRLVGRVVSFLSVFFLAVYFASLVLGSFSASRPEMLFTLDEGGV